MRSLSGELSKSLQQLDPGFARQVRIARNKAAYINAVVRVCGGNTAMAALILAHTNAVYIRKDDSLRKGAEKTRPYILCEVCLDDALVRSEVNIRQEILKVALAHEGISFDEFRIITAKGGMRSRHPFSRHAEALLSGDASALADVGIQVARPVQVESASEKTANLENVKRALILVFGDLSDAVLASIEAADISLAVMGSFGDGRLSSRPTYWLRLYSSDERIRALLTENAPAIVSRAREIGLRIRRLEVCASEGPMRGRSAFPRMGAPECYFSNPR